MTKELWAVIEPTHRMVSNYGRVRSINEKNKKRFAIPCKKLRGNTIYPTIRGTGSYLDELVLCYFSDTEPGPLDTPQHIDGDPFNCHIDNLYWGWSGEHEANIARLRGYEHASYYRDLIGRRKRIKEASRRWRKREKDRKEKERELYYSLYSKHEGEFEDSVDF